MPLTLYKYMLGELLRVMLLSTGVLVTVIAFGAAIKPLARNDLLTVTQTVKYIALASVPMLQFALPFASGFASTMVFYRFTSDNEILAMSASGISYRRILAPILGLGVVLTLVMLLLTQLVIPRFWGMLQQTVTNDVTRLFQASIQAGTPFELDTVQIYADRLLVEDAPEDTGAVTRMRLFHVAAAELDDDGRIVTDVTAEQAVVDVHQRNGQTLLKLVMRDTVAYNRATGQLIAAPEIRPQRAIVVPSVFEDDPLFMTRGELREVRDNPDSFGPIRNLKAMVVEACQYTALWNAIRDVLRREGRVEFSGPPPNNRTYVIEADDLRGRRFARSDGPVILTQSANGRDLLRVESPDVVARIRQSPGGAGEGPLALDFTLLQNVVRDLRLEGGANERSELNFLALQPKVSYEDPALSDASADELIAYCATLDDPGSLLLGRVDGLERRIGAVTREATSRLLRRHALSVTAPLLLLLGAVLAMWRRETLPLTIYFIAFAPSIADLLLISSGDHMIRDGGLVGGAALMWSGNALMLAVILGSYLRMRRN